MPIRPHKQDIQAVFGPVPSRRLGQSLGIDPIPLKTCNWNCVYCQLGTSAHVVTERREWIPGSLILEQVEEALDRHGPGEIDWITLVGSGEPTLHSGIGDVIRGIKAMTAIPVAVITNGALLYDAEVRTELVAADAVLPSLDAGSDRLYRLINRPHATLSFERYVEGLIAFRKMYDGRLWLEVMLLQGINDSEEALVDLARVIARIEPDAIHLDVPSRPPAEAWVRPASEEGLMRASAILGKTAQVVHPVDGTFDLGGYGNVVDAVIGIITRHPMREDQLERSLARWTSGQLHEALSQLEADGRAQVIERYGVRFWSTARARYANRGRHQAGGNDPSGKGRLSHSSGGGGGPRFDA